MRHPEKQELGMYFKGERFLFWHLYYAYTEFAERGPGEMYPNLQLPKLKCAFSPKRAVKKAYKYAEERRKLDKPVEVKRYDGV